MAKATTQTAEMQKPATAESRAVVAWDEQLAREAEAAAGMEASAGGGNFFSVRGGILSFNGIQMPDNQMLVVVIDHILENVFYADEFNSDKVTPPTCFALGRDEKTLAPHKVVFEAGQEQNDTCPGCPMNEWNTAPRGRGKACRNIRRLALIPAGEFDKDGTPKLIDDPIHYQNAQIGYLKLPVTSVSGWATLVKQLNAVFKRPPVGMFMRCRVVPDQKSQFKVIFDVVKEVDESLLPALMERRQGVATTIDFPYQLDADGSGESAAPERAPSQSGGSTRRPGPKVNQRPEVKRRNKF